MIEAHSRKRRTSNHMAAVLSVVYEAGRWRVRIMWPNGTKRYFGKFDTEREAGEWIYDHRWLTTQVTNKAATLNEPSGA